MGETAEIDVAAAIRAWILETFMKGSRPEALTDDTRLLGGDLLDSIGMLELTVHIEETWGISIAAEEVTPDHFGSVRALAHFVQRKLGAR